MDLAVLFIGLLNMHSFPVQLDIKPSQPGEIRSINVSSKRRQNRFKRARSWCFFITEVDPRANLQALSIKKNNFDGLVGGRSFRGDTVAINGLTDRCYANRKRNQT